MSIPLILATIGYKMQGQYLLNGSGRYEVWTLTWDFFWKESNIWTGTGLGSFQVLGQALQERWYISQGITEGGFAAFFWVHNDWLQTLLETGIPGFVLALLVFIQGLWALRRSPQYMISLLTFGTVNFIQMGLRWWLFTAFGAYLISLGRPSPSSR